MHEWKFPGVAGFSAPDQIPVAEIVIVAVCKKCGTIRTRSVMSGDTATIDLSGNCDLPKPRIG